jgi:tetratricopeptide (TPR) repeat protein
LRIRCFIFTGCPESQLDAAFAHLQSAEFIHEPASGDVGYIFKHALTQEVAYNSLLIERRKLLHERIAGAIESLFDERLDDHLKDLAHHYRRSNNTVKAVDYLRRAGEQAAVRAFYEEAIKHLNGALELLEKLDSGELRDAHELAVRTALMVPLIPGHSLSAGGRLNAERLRELCEAAGDTQHLAMVLTHLFFFHRSATSLDKAATFAKKALELAEQNQGEFDASVILSPACLPRKGEYPAARLHLERALGMSQQTQDLIIADPNIAVGLLNCAVHLATVCWILGYPDQAQRQTERLAELLRRSPPPFAHAAGMHHLLTMRRDFLRDYRYARVQAEEALDRSTQGGIRWGIVFGTIWLGRIMVAEGAVDEGIEKLARAIPAVEWDQHLGRLAGRRSIRQGAAGC